MTYVLTAEQMRAVDRAATADFGVPTLLLMENAGRGVAEVVARALGGRVAGRRVRVVCGAGNNGGDGFVAARHLALAGAEVSVLLAASREKIAAAGGDAAMNLRALEALGAVPVVAGDAWNDAAAWSGPLAGADAIVDALFGTGLRADVAGVPAAAITAMNAAAGIKIAVDIPSGIDADTGRVHGVAFRADVTATMGAPKLGFVVDADVPAGRVEVVSLGVPIRPPAALGPFCHAVDVEETLSGVPRRGPSGHKGTAGHLLIVAGSAGKTGAAWLSARAAMRAGVGLCTVASTAAGQAALDAKAIEIMTARYADGDDADASSAGRLSALASGMRALAIGPGIPTGPGMRALVEEIVARSPLPIVVDADALNLLAPHAARVTAAAPAPRVLTPHPGEMARLCGTDDRRGTARAGRVGAQARRRHARDRRAQGGAHADRAPRRHGVHQPDREPGVGDRGRRRRAHRRHRRAARSGHGRVRSSAPGRAGARARGRSRLGGDRRPGDGRGRPARRHRRDHGAGAGREAVRSPAVSAGERSAIVSDRSLSRTW